MLQHSSDLEQFREILATRGVDAGLAFLNKRSSYQFTAIYAIHGQTMRNVHFYDRVGGYDLGALREVPLMDSFCQYVVKEGRFITLDSAPNVGLEGHAYQRVVASYIGLPIVDGAGKLIGTFCHLDFDPHPSDDREFEFLQGAMPLLSEFVK